MTDTYERKFAVKIRLCLKDIGIFKSNFPAPTLSGRLFNPSDISKKIVPPLFITFSYDNHAKYQVVFRDHSNIT